MKTVTQYLREHLLNRKGIPASEPAVDLRKVLVESLRTSERSRRFEDLMRNRLVMGAIRYGKMHAAKPKYDRISSTIQRLQLYQEAGNTELLVNAANLALLEFEEGDHPLRHFSAIDEHNFHTEVIK